MFTKKQKIDMFSKKLDGYTFEEIGKMYGVSRQAVQQLLGYSCKNRNPQKVSSKALRKYIFENCVSLKDFIIKCFGDDASYSTYHMLLTGKRGTYKPSDINKIIKFTGLSYEEIFMQEEE